MRQCLSHGQVWRCTEDVRLLSSQEEMLLLLLMGRETGRGEKALQEEGESREGMEVKGSEGEDERMTISSKTERHQVI